MRFHTSLLHILHPKPRNMRSQPTSRILQRYAAWKSSMVPQVVSASSIVYSSGHSLGENRTCSFLPKAKSAVHDTSRALRRKTSPNSEEVLSQTSSSANKLGRKFCTLCVQGGGTRANGKVVFSCLPGRGKDTELGLPYRFLHIISALN